MPHHLRASIPPQRNTRSLPVVQSSNFTREGKGPSRVRQTRLGKDSGNSCGGGVPSKHKGAECGTAGGVYTTTNGSLWLVWQWPRSQCYELRVHRQAGQPPSHCEAANSESEAEERSDQTFRKATWAAGHRTGQGREQRGAVEAQGVGRERITANAHCQPLGP